MTSVARLRLWVSRWLMRWHLLGAAAAGAAGLVHVGLLLYIFARRLLFPLDLEWEEGGMLCHAQRLLDGHSLYAAPSADFIPFLYTPFYPALLAALGKVFGLSYVLGRLVSIASFAGAMALVVLAVRRQLGRNFAGTAWGLAAAGLIASSFHHTAGWYDLVRNDSLYLLLIVAALYLLAFHHRSHRAVLAAGVLMGLAFLTKQTASIFVVYSGLALLALNWRKLPQYVATVGVVAGGSTLLLNHLTDGWFWRVIYELHQNHEFSTKRLAPMTQEILFKASPVVFCIIALWLVVALVGWVATRRTRPGAGGRLFGLSLALCGVAVASVGFATQWADKNAFIPGLFFPAAFAAVACGDLGARGARGLRRWIAPPLSLLLGAALTAQLLTQLYPPREHLPRSRDWLAARQFLTLLAEADKPLLVPYHPWYPHKVGGRCSYHHMGINDITRAGLPFPADLRRRITEQRYGTIIFDNFPAWHYGFVLSYYRTARRFRRGEMPEVAAGYRVRPTMLLVPKPTPSPRSSSKPRPGHQLRPAPNAIKLRPTGSSPQRKPTPAR